MSNEVPDDNYVRVRALRAPDAPEHAPDFAGWCARGKFMNHGDEATVHAADAERLVKAGRAERIA